MRRVGPVLLFSVIALCSCAKRATAPVAVPSPPAVAERPADNRVGVAPSASTKAQEETPQPAKTPEVTVLGGIAGTISDPIGAIISNVTVTVTNQVTGQSIMARTDLEGRYSVTGLRTGIYRVSFASPGFRMRVIDDLSVGVGEAATLSTQLYVGSSSKAVTVSEVFRKPHRVRVRRSPTGSTGAKPGDVEAENEAFEAWHKALPDGLSVHHVDPIMRLGKESTVTFTIHGPSAPVFTPAPGTTSDRLQVSPMMSVLLTAPNNPDGFKIVDGASPQNPKRVAPDGATTWTWTVTPQQLGKLKLHIEAYVLRRDRESDNASYKSYDDTIEVHSITLWGYLVMGVTWVLNHPAESLKWILPGGAGAAMIGKFIHWLLTRKKKATVGP